MDHNLLPCEFTPSVFVDSIKSIETMTQYTFCVVRPKLKRQLVCETLELLESIIGFRAIAKLFFNVMFFSNTIFIIHKDEGH